MGKTSVRTEMDILSKVEKDLRNLPRHQWDSYLWDFCSQFVRLRSAAGDGGPEAPLTAASQRSGD
jgi:hypothetical protein